VDILEEGVDVGELDGAIAVPGRGVIANAEDELAPGVELEVLGVLHHLAEEVDEAEFTEFRDFHE
jgi:hypothetical protein